MVEQPFELSRDVVQPPLRPAEGLPCFCRGVLAELLGRIASFIGGVQGAGGGLPQGAFSLSGQLFEGIACVSQSLLGVPAEFPQVPFAASSEEPGNDRHRDKSGLLH